jgi:hypothetical protein
MISNHVELVHALPAPRLGDAGDMAAEPVGPCDEGKSKAVVNHGESARALREALAVVAQFIFSDG